MRVTEEKVILVDMDAVLANFEAGFLEKWRQLYPDREFVPLGDRITPRVYQQYPAHHLEDINRIYAGPHFF